MRQLYILALAAMFYGAATIGAMQRHLGRPQSDLPAVKRILDSSVYNLIVMEADRDTLAIEKLGKLDIRDSLATIKALVKAVRRVMERKQFLIMNQGRDTVEITGIDTVRLSTEPRDREFEQAPKQL